MGNSCPAGCLISSSGLVHHSYGEEEDEIGAMVKVVRTTDNELFEFPGPLFVKDLLLCFHGFAVFLPHNKSSIESTHHDKPLHPDMQLHFSHLYYLKPLPLPQPSIHPCFDNGTHPVSHPTHSPCLSSIQPSSPQPTAVLNFAFNGTHHPEPSLRPSPPPSKSLPSQQSSPKALKKVRFSDMVIYIGSDDGRPIAVLPPMSPNCTSSMKQGALTGRDPSSMASGTGTKPTDPPIMASSTCTKPAGRLNGVVRLKVVISKQQLTELMSPKTSEAEADALMERMIAPMLSPTSATHKSDSPSHSMMKSWKPYLDQIPEDHSFREP